MCFCMVRVFSESHAGQGASRVICPISCVDMSCRARKAGVSFHHQNKNVACRMRVVTSQRSPLAIMDRFGSPWLTTRLPIDSGVRLLRYHVVSRLPGATREEALEPRAMEATRSMAGGKKLLRQMRGQTKDLADKKNYSNCAK